MTFQSFSFAVPQQLACRASGMSLDGVGSTCAVSVSSATSSPSVMSTSAVHTIGSVGSAVPVHSLANYQFSLVGAIRKPHAPSKCLCAVMPVDANEVRFILHSIQLVNW